ncbi:hypothetical protein ACS0TY_005752 [Phlomoides rotata]
MLPRAIRKIVVLFLVQEYLFQKLIFCLLLHYLGSNNNNRRVRRRVGDVQSYGMLCRIPDQLTHMNRMYTVSELDCISNLRMDRNSFAHLCVMMRELGGLVDHRYVGVEEQVSMFLSLLAHHKKNRILKFNYIRSGQTISKFVHIVLKAVLKLHSLFLVTPKPVPAGSTNPRWKWFKLQHQPCTKNISKTAPTALKTATKNISKNSTKNISKTAPTAAKQH